MYKNSKWAEEIISMQKPDGSWGDFHTLSASKGEKFITEHALRRLLSLGFTSQDKPIQKAVLYMINCIEGRKQIPDRREVLHNWDIFTDLMLATWIVKFTNACPRANHIAKIWADIIGSSFKQGSYNHEEYLNNYTKAFNEKPRHGRLVDFVTFYPVSLISKELDKTTQRLVFDFILNNENGIYYIYGSKLSKTPSDFHSKQASRYLGAIELLLNYEHCSHKLQFVSDWLNEHKSPEGTWDMGSGAKDGLYFPLSDSWRKSFDREKDCTYRIEKIMNKISL